MSGPPPRVDVWVCARPRAPWLGEVLDALAAAGASARVAVAPAGQGPAIARNEALARCDGEVLALVDDDVEVSPGWLDALRAAWSRDDAAELGCVGGPLGAAFAGARPRWLGDELLPALGVDDGPPAAEASAGVPVPIDATRRTFHGGNVSFRAAALRGVGGFWPAHGHPGLRDWLCEEHRAQHELARAGWRAAWVREAYAARRIDCAEVRPVDVVLLRARAGARTGAVGDPGPRTLTVRAAASAAAGVPVAAARRDVAKLVERSSRAAQNVAVLASPLLLHRDLQPAVTRTPFLFSVPSAAPHGLVTAVRRARPRRRGVRGRAPLVLLYHRVAERREDPLALAVSPRRFAEQLEVLAARATPVPLEQIVAGEAPPDAVAVTVDDGYADVVQAGLPALEAAGVPATVFVSTGHVGSGGAFWWDALARLLRVAPTDGGPLSVVIGDDTRVWAARNAGERATAFRFLTAWLHAQPPEAIDAALLAIASWAGVIDPLAPPPEDRPMTVHELRRLAASELITVGSHGRLHPCLAVLSPERQAAELVAARNDLSGWLGDAPAGLAYPFGVPGVDMDAATREAAGAAGHAYAAVNAAGRVAPRTARMAIPRHAAPDAEADAFDRWLCALPS